MTRAPSLADVRLELDELELDAMKMIVSFAALVDTLCAIKVDVTCVASVCIDTSTIVHIIGKRLLSMNDNIAVRTEQLKDCSL